ncbi:hypothetical protein B0O80DRAFT_526695, partial [Mortierella sp. GBAus27b]
MSLGSRQWFQGCQNLTSLTVNDSRERSNRVEGATDAEGPFKRSFKVKDGHATIHLRSRIHLDQVYQVFENIQSIYGLCISLFVDLKDISVGDTMDRVQRHDSIFDIIRHHLTYSATIMNAPGDFVQQSSLLSRNDDFPNLSYLDVDLSALTQDILGMKTLLSRMPNLSSLVLDEL